MVSNTKHKPHTLQTTHKTQTSHITNHTQNTDLTHYKPHTKHKPHTLQNTHKTQTSYITEATTQVYNNVGLSISTRLKLFEYLVATKLVFDSLLGIF